MLSLHVHFWCAFFFSQAINRVLRTWPKLGPPVVPDLPVEAMSGEVFVRLGPGSAIGIRPPPGLSHTGVSDASSVAGFRPPPRLAEP